jgi:hypothetical protein
MTPISQWILEDIKKKRFQYKYEGLLPDIVTLAERLKWQTDDQIEIKIISENNRSSIIIDNISIKCNTLPESNLVQFEPK